MCLKFTIYNAVFIIVTAQHTVVLQIQYKITEKLHRIINNCFSLHLFTLILHYLVFVAL